MGPARSRRSLLIVLAAAILIAAGTVAGYRYALLALKSGVEEALGPDSEVRGLRVGWHHVEIDGLRISGPQGWPSEDTLRAERVVIVPSLKGLFSGTYRISSITITKPYLSVLRTKGGKLLVVPSLLQGQKESGTEDPSAEKPRVMIGRLAFEDSAIEFFDETLGPRRKEIRLEKMKAVVKDIRIPDFDSRSAFELSGTVKGARQDGEVSLSGWAVVSTKDSSVAMRLRSVELAGIQPYFSRSKDARVKAGTLDLDLKSDVRDSRLKAPGRITISGLKLEETGGIWGTFMGMPKDAVLALLEDKGGRITLDFVLEGDIGNPKFSLNETFSKRLAVSMADTLKMGIGSVAQGAGSLGEKGVEAASGVVKGVGGTIQQFFGGKKK